MAYSLKIIIASTRPGRKGPSIAAWVQEVSSKNELFNIEMIDLATINLPFLDEPDHPRLKKYTQEHTKRWSEMIDTADAFIIVTCEYNFGYPAALKNALDFLYNEWNHKPVGFVSYGGVAAGTRSVQQLKQIVTALNMMPIASSVNIPFFTKYIDEGGKFSGDETLTKSLNGMLAELEKWTGALQQLRSK
jgi:NAD(P)H-dependent FMN reductase